MPPKRPRDSLARSADAPSEKQRTFNLTTTLIRGVFRLNLFPADRGNSVVRGDRGLAHADRDQGDLARVAGNIPRRVDKRQVRLASRRLDLDLALALELETPVGDRAEVGVKAHQREQGVTVDLL